MSWIRDENGMPEYKHSIYDKDCLPTWDEVNTFLKDKSFDYDPMNVEHQVIDPYWKRPHRKLLLGWVCNQLNKILMELDEPLATKICEEKECRGYSFYIDTFPDPTLLEETMNLANDPPPIYQCKLPGRDEYSIFKTDYPSINIDTVDGHVALCIALYKEDGYEIITPDKPLYIYLLKITLHDIIEYFRDTPGWKDADGNLREME